MQDNANAMSNHTARVAEGVPANAKLVLATLITVAAVANLPLAMANIALPSIGTAFNASQTQLNLVAVGYSLGLACSVLWLGALGDRYGRKLLCLLGVIIAIPAALLAGLAPTIEVMIAARLLGGFAAGMAYPTTLSLIGAIFNSLFGALLAAGYAAAATAAIAASPGAAQVTPQIQSEITMSFAGAQSVATQYPQYAEEILSAAQTSFLAGDQQAYIAGILAVLLGAVLVFFLFPRHEEENALLLEYHRQDVAGAPS